MKLFYRGLIAICAGIMLAFSLTMCNKNDAVATSRAAATKPNTTKPNTAFVATNIYTDRTERRLDRFLGAVQHQDFPGIFYGTLSYVEQIQKIREQNPQVLWDKIIEKYYNEEGKYSKNGIFTIPDAKLVQYLLPDSDPKILEWHASTRGDGSYPAKDWYVQIDYQSPSDAPLPPYSQSPLDPPESFVKQAILVIKTDNGGNFISCQVVPDGIILWDQKDVQLTFAQMAWFKERTFVNGGVGFGKGNYFSSLNVNLVGGTPPYSVFCISGTYVAQGEQQGNQPGLITFDEQLMNKIAEKTLFPNGATIVARDASGKSVIVDLPQTPGLKANDGIVYVRSPSDAAPIAEAAIIASNQPFRSEAFSVNVLEAIDNKSSETKLEKVNNFINSSHVSKHADDLSP